MGSLQGDRTRARFAVWIDIRVLVGPGSISGAKIRNLWQITDKIPSQHIVVDGDVKGILILLMRNDNFACHRLISSTRMNGYLFCCIFYSTYLEER